MHQSLILGVLILGVLIGVFNDLLWLHVGLFLSACSLSLPIFVFQIDIYLNLNIPGIDHFHDSHNVVKHKAKLFTVV